MRQAYKDIAQRLANAEENMIGLLSEYGGISREDAAIVLSVYRKARAVKRDAVGGRYHVTHGAFLDRDAIRRALEIGKSPGGGKRRSTPFAKLSRKLAARGAADPKALAAWIGRKQIGQKAMTRRAVAGKLAKRGGKKRHAPSVAAMVRETMRQRRLRKYGVR